MAHPRAKEIDRRLKKAYPDARCSLDFENPFQLLIATILAAQCTDEKVNQVTPDLFERFPTPEAMADADAGEIETLIHSTGFFRNKTKSILKCCRALADDHDGDVPDSMEALAKLPGVGRKTANVILGNAFDIPGVVVDTHVKRLSRRLGLTKNENPDKIETDLCEQVPEKDWTGFGHRLVYHGRAVCVARKPKCADCVVNDLCPSADEFMKDA